MTRAGREPTEDVKRRLGTACHEAGLRVMLSRFSLSPSRDCRCIVVAAAIKNPLHKWPTVEIVTHVKTSGDVGEVEVRCQASDEEPMRAMYTAPTLRDCTVPLDQLPETLKAVLAERQTVINLMGDGEKPPFQIRWRWAVPFGGDEAFGPACP